MLDYLLYVIEQNIFFIFLIIMILTIVSQISKGFRYFFFACLGLVTSYFALLCFYKLGIGSDRLYEFSAKYVYMICLGFERIAECIFQKDTFFIRLFQGMLVGEFINGEMFALLSISLLIFTFVDLNMSSKNEQLSLKKKKTAEQFYLDETVSNSMALYIMNVVFRC